MSIEEGFERERDRCELTWLTDCFELLSQASETIKASVYHCLAAPCCQNDFFELNLKKSRCLVSNIHFQLLLAVHRDVTGPT